MPLRRKSSSVHCQALFTGSICKTTHVVNATKYHPANYFNRK